VPARHAYLDRLKVGLIAAIIFGHPELVPGLRVTERVSG
jgi:hypothetical protein